MLPCRLGSGFVKTKGESSGVRAVSCPTLTGTTKLSGESGRRQSSSTCARAHTVPTHAETQERRGQRLHKTRLQLGNSSTAGK